jgi:hypothetical protein
MARNDAEPGYSLTSLAADRIDAVVSQLPHALEVLRFFLAAEDELIAVDAARAWRWRRHA